MNKWLNRILSREFWIEDKVAMPGNTEDIAVDLLVLILTLSQSYHKTIAVWSHQEEFKKQTTVNDQSHRKFILCQITVEKHSSMCIFINK